MHRFTTTPSLEYLEWVRDEVRDCAELIPEPPESPKDPDGWVPTDSTRETMDTVDEILEAFAEAELGSPPDPESLKGILEEYAEQVASTRDRAWETAWDQYEIPDTTEAHRYLTELHADLVATCAQPYRNPKGDR